MTEGGGCMSYKLCPDLHKAYSTEIDEDNDNGIFSSRLLMMADSRADTGNAADV